MAKPRDIRRLAFQALFQIDAHGGDDSHVEGSLEAPEGFTASDMRKSLELARGAWAGREGADAELLTLAPTWPAHRQASVDRALLRLAHHEMTATRTHPKIVVNEAVELAKEFGGEKSPGFVNGLLDKILKRVLVERPQPVEEPPASPS